MHMQLTLCDEWIPAISRRPTQLDSASWFIKICIQLGPGNTLAGDKRVAVPGAHLHNAGQRLQLEVAAGTLKQQAVPRPVWFGSHNGALSMWHVVMHIL
jgi:hypothetical protein